MTIAHLRDEPGGHPHGQEELRPSSRVAAGVVQGIGFLGAGIILQRGGSLTGLTTAATVWAMAAAGLLVAQELRLLAFLMTLLVLAMLETRPVWRFVSARAVRTGVLKD